MKQLFIAALLTLSACATPSQIYSSEVDTSLLSTKPISAVSQCLQLRWAIAPITTPDGEMSFPMKNGYGQVLGLLTLTPKPNGTLMELRKTGALMIGGNGWKKCA